jgi:uncharacterized protein YciI
VTAGKENVMQFLYRLTPVRIEMVTVGPAAEEQAIVSEHFSRLEALAEEGVVLLAGRTQDDSPRTFGLVILQAESDEQAREIMDNDPAVQKGVMRAELFPFRIALAGNLRGD